MPKIFVSGIIDSDIDRVWSVVRNFSSPAHYSSDIRSSNIENDEPADRVGVVRRLVLENGDVLREQLITLSDGDQFYEYRLLPPEPVPIRNYVGRVSLVPITDCRKTLIHWTGRYDPAPGDTSDMTQILNEVYAASIEGIRIYLAHP